jgi:hypothetical protein
MSVILLSDVRLSFPHLAEPQISVNEVSGQKRISYNAEFLMTPDHPGFKQFMQRYAELATENVREHAQAVMQMIASDRKSRCFGQGSEKVNKKTFQPYDGYADRVYITAGKDTPPQVIQADGKPVGPTQFGPVGEGGIAMPGNPAHNPIYQQLTRSMYGGCRVNVAIKPWWQKANPAKQHGHGVRCDLIAIQFFKDDTPFGEGVADASGMFGQVAAAPAAPSPAGAAMPLPPFMMGQ